MDVYDELMTVGAGHAAAALSRIVGSRVVPGGSSSAELTLVDLDAPVPGADEVAIVLIGVGGGLAGHLGLVVPAPHALLAPLDLPDEFLGSALGEIGGIVATRFVAAVSGTVGLGGEVQPPVVGFAPRGAALDAVVALTAPEPVLVLRAGLHVAGGTSLELLYGPGADAVARVRGPA